MMKYEIDSDLKKVAKQKAPSNIYLYPIVNMVMKLSTCTSDDKVTVNKYVTPGYENGKLSTFLIEPRKPCGILPCIIFYHGGGFLLKASKAHYQIAKWYAEMAKCKVVFTEFHEVKGACHGFEAALESRIVEESMQRRIHWIQSVLNRQ